MFLWSRSFAVLYFSVLHFAVLYAQPKLEASFHYGRILKINPVFPEITQNAWSLDLAWETHWARDQAWTRQMGGVRWWLNCQVHQLGNPDVLGFAFALIPVLEKPLWQGEKATVYFRQGIGIAGMSHPYDRHRNPQNSVLGGRINFASQARIGGRYRWGSGLQLGGGFGFSHFSNARTRIPNIGANVLAAYVSVAFTSPSPSPHPNRPPPTPETTTRHHFPGLRIGLGRHAAKVPDGPAYSVYSLGFFWTWHRSSKLVRWQVGTEWYFAHGSYAFGQEFGFRNPARRSIGGALFGGLELMMGRLSLVLQSGPYLKVPIPHNYKVYTRLGTHFYLKPPQAAVRRQCFIGLYIHARGGEADYFDVVLGRTF
jgi:hypothetical protein